MFSIALCAHAIDSKLILSEQEALQYHTEKEASGSKARSSHESWAKVESVLSANPFSEDIADGIGSDVDAVLLWVGGAGGVRVPGLLDAVEAAVGRALPSFNSVGLWMQLPHDAVTMGAKHLNNSTRTR